MRFQIPSDDCFPNNVAFLFPVSAPTYSNQQIVPLPLFNFSAKRVWFVDFAFWMKQFYQFRATEFLKSVLVLPNPHIRGTATGSYS